MAGGRLALLLLMLVLLGGLIAPATVSAASPQLGLNDEWMSLGDPAVAAAEGLGADVARFPVIAPSDDVPGPEHPAWNGLDRTVATLTAVSIRPLFVVCPDPCHALSMSPSYVEFVAALAYRYPGAAIQVWNEPNANGFDPATYAGLVRAVRAAVPATTQIVAVGAAPVGEWEAWSRRALRRVRGQDVTPAIHLYPEARRSVFFRPAALKRIGRYVRRAYQDLKKVTGRRPWVTEVGFSSTVGMGSEADQAAGMTRALGMLERVGAPVIVVHRLADPPGTQSSWHAGLGILRADLSVKPAAAPVAALGAAR